MITNNTKRAIWSRGTMAFIMEFRTTCKPKRKEDTRYEPDFYALPYQNFYNYTLLEINDTGMQTISLKKNLLLRITKHYCNIIYSIRI